MNFLARYLDRGADGRVAPLQASLTKLFDKYRDDPKELPDEIGMDGTQQLLEDLSISIEDIAALVLFELVQSPSLGTIMREGWVDGWTEVGADTPAKMRNVILQRRSQLPSDREIFKNVYNHTFSLALAERQKSLPLDTAAEMWRLLFSENGVHWQSKNTPWLEWWLEYNHEKVKKAVNKDLWKQTLTFAYQTLKDDTLSFWSEDSSWPSVIDEFVEWVNKEKRSVGGDAMEIA
jgi:DCN1-like protein 1/2